MSNLGKKSMLTGKLMERSPLKDKDKDNEDGGSTGTDTRQVTVSNVDPVVAGL
jgi:hypothetical protein